MESNGHDLRGIEKVQARSVRASTIIGPRALSITKRRARGNTSEPTGPNHKSLSLTVLRPTQQVALDSPVRKDSAFV